MKIYVHDAGHMTKIATTPTVITLEKILFQKHSNDFNETLYVAAGTPAHYSLFNL